VPKARLPISQTPLTEGTNVASRPYYTFLSDLSTNVAALSVVVGDIQTKVAGSGSTLSPNANVTGGFSITTRGTLKTGIVSVLLDGDVDQAQALSFYGALDAGKKGWWNYSANFQKSTLLGAQSLDLADLSNSGAGSLLAITRDGKGRITGTKAATVTGTTGRITVANGDAVAGLPTVDLSPVTDVGGGTLQKTTFDAYGRKTGTSASTASDLLAVATGWHVLTGSNVQTALNSTDTFLTSVGTMAFQNASAVAITGGTINGSTVGATTPASGAFTSIFSTQDAVIHGLTVGLGLGNIGTNTAVGAGALQSNTTGDYNFAAGFNALARNTIGRLCLAIGYNSSYNNISGTLNLSVGYYSLSNNATGSYNLALGSYAAKLSVSANGVTALGSFAAVNNLSDYIVAVGYNCLYENTSGTNNLGIGYNTGRGITTGSGNTIIGSNITGLSATLANNIIFASGSAVRAQFDGTNWKLSGSVSATSTLITGGFTVATLPAGTVGMRAYVTNALTPSFGTTLVGGGTVVATAFYNGTNWINA
jgi:hypothetical protein